MTGSEYTPAQGGGILSLSANGATAGTGILWAAVPIGGGSPALDRGKLAAYNVQDVTQANIIVSAPLGLTGVGLPSGPRPGAVC